MKTIALFRKALPTSSLARRIAALILTLALATTAATPMRSAQAQTVDSNLSIAIVQNGVIVGEIFRSDTDPERYVEHWVLYPGYAYVGPRNGFTTELRPGYRDYRSATDFLARVPFATGSRYVKVDCLDGATIPGR